MLYELPLVAYALFGSSPQLTMGPDAATCALVAPSLAPLAIGLRHMELSITLSLAVGSLCVVGGMLRLGGLATFLSCPILVGFSQRNGVDHR
jgi:MFS superfamily sulfate permease-like transporter